MIHTIVVLLFAAALSVAVIWLRLRFADRGLDLPGDRSLHSIPTPHGGGLGIVLPAIVVGLWLGIEITLIAGVGALALVSLLDDWRHLPFWTRLGVHLFVATAVVFLHDAFPPVHAIVAIVAIAWAINAYNFMDGADGIAGSMAIVGFGAYAIGFAMAGMSSLSLFCGVLVVAAFGFMLFNWHPARVFMGDVGSIPLGFLAGALGWYGVVAQAWPTWFALMAFAPFLLDATVTLGRRALRREKVWQAHRDHYYQRMVRMGIPHDLMCGRWLGVMIVGALIALTTLTVARGDGWIVLFVWAGLLILLGRRIDVRWNRYKVATK